MANDIIGVGLATVDHLFVTGEVCGSHRSASDYGTQGGGLVATAVAAAGRLGASAEIWTCIGDDPGGEFVLREFERDGVDTSQVCIIPGGATATCAVFVDELTGERWFVFYNGRGLGGRHGFDLSRIDSAACVLADAHLLADSLVAARYAQRAGVPVITDIEEFTGENLELARRSDILIVPEACALTHSGTDDPGGAIAALLRLGPRFAAITMGGRGGAWAGQLRPGDPVAPLTHYDAFAVDVVDTTGCGDVFHGAFAAGLVRGWDAGRIVRFASAASALKCRALGGRSGIPTFEEVMSFLGNA